MTFFAVLLTSLFACMGPWPSTPTTDEPPQGVVAQSTPQHCSFDHAAEGPQRLALVVGVGRYLSESVRELTGPRTDATRIRDTLVELYGFDPKVCFLLDEDATTEAFLGALGQLAAKADADDHVAVYFAGHGSTMHDVSGDETDGRDETLLLADARHEGTCDLSDDVLNAKLERIALKTRNLTVILDSCHSESATRGEVVPRFQSPSAARAQACAEAAARSADGSGGLVGGAGLDGAVVLAASADNRPALEAHGEGVFTTALWKAMRTDRQVAPTWRQIRRAVMTEVTGQRPWFHGPIDEPVFGAERERSTFGWNVDQVSGASVTLSGLPLPGWSVGARVRVYPRDAPSEVFDDPMQATAELDVVEVVNHKTVRATFVGDPVEVRPDLDVGVLAVPGPDLAKLAVRIRAEGPGAVPEERRADVRAAVSEAEELVGRVDLDPEGLAFEIAAYDGVLQLRGPEDRPRVIFDGRDPMGALVETLDNFAVQKALLELRGEGRHVLVANESLEVRLVPKPPKRRQQDCTPFRWSQAEPNTLQVVPLCQRWAVSVRLRPDADVGRLLVGGAVLYNDGGIEGFPKDGRQQSLAPGDEVVFDMLDVHASKPPFGIVERVVVAGTNEQEHLDWATLTRTARTRSSNATVGSLGVALEDYMGRRRGGGSDPDVPAAAWTTTVLPFRAELVEDFQSVAVAEAPATREYSIPYFDLRPYRPADENTALAQVLQQVEYLTYGVRPEGVGYCQHTWEGASDLANLTEPQPRVKGEGRCTGIDCSRSVWFAFTRAKVPYPEFLTTWGMEAGSSLMEESFDACDDGPRLGDLLVYVGTNAKGEERRHVVMVIDPDKYVAWGSHGWDGSTEEGEPLREDLPEHITPLAGGKTKLKRTGVAFQMTKEGRDWAAWDWKDIRQVACWRHKAFAAEYDAGLWEPARLMDPCTSRTCKQRPIAAFQTGRE